MSGARRDTVRGISSVTKLNDSKLRIGKYSTSFWTWLSRPLEAAYLKAVYLKVAYLKLAYLKALIQFNARNLCTYGKLNY